MRELISQQGVEAFLVQIRDDLPQPRTGDSSASRGEMAKRLYRNVCATHSVTARSPQSLTMRVKRPTSTPSSTGRVCRTARKTAPKPSFQASSTLAAAPATIQSRAPARLTRHGVIATSSQ
jgi:hypothetical protein